MPRRNSAHHVEQKDEQIVCLPGRGGQCFVVHDFKIDQARAICRRIVQDILGGPIAVRPAAAKMIAPKLVGAAKFCSRGSQHFSRQGSAIEMFPQTFARQLFGNDRAFAGGRRAIAVAIEHLKAVDFPALPLLRLAPESNRNVRHSKIEICEIGQLFAVKITPLHHDCAAAPDLF